MKTNKSIGWLLIAGAVGVLIPYTILTIIFQYPDILREETSSILTKFHQGGNQLIWTWFSFALAGLPLVPAYILIGKKLQGRSSLTRVATTIGVAGLIVQMIGLLRWTFVVPVLSETFVTGDASTKAAAIVSFKMIHQFGGVLLGEHLGQLFTVIWTILISVVLGKQKLVSKWVMWLGIGSAVIYFMAQAELLSTVMPGIPVIDIAGFIGSTLWLIWLVILGVKFISSQKLKV